MPRPALRWRSKKRANREGTVTQRKDGRGRPRSMASTAAARFYYGATREDVAEKLIGAQKAVQDGRPLPDERVTLAEYLDFWLATSHELGSRFLAVSCTSIPSAITTFGSRGKNPRLSTACPPRWLRLRHGRGAAVYPP